MDEVVAIPLCSLAFFFLLFGFLAVLRFINYRETLALAEKGLVRPDRSRANGKDTLRWGIVITALGLALCLGLYPLGFMAGPRFPLGLGPWMLLGLVPTFFGLALILIYVVTREKRDEEPKVKREE
jgi:O-antigen/teichoic acid export membrane protein